LPSALAPASPSGCELSDPGAGICCKAAFPSLWTKHEERSALPAAANSDCIFGPLDPTEPRTLEGGLGHLAGKDLPGRLRTIQIEFSPREGRLDRHRLFVLEHLALAGTSSESYGRDERHPHDRVSHSSNLRRLRCSRTRATRPLVRRVQEIVPFHADTICQEGSRRQQPSGHSEISESPTRPRSRSFSVASCTLGSRG
jgi:hypothetical protein